MKCYFLKYSVFNAVEIMKWLGKFISNFSNFNQTSPLHIIFLNTD